MKQNNAFILFIICCLFFVFLSCHNNGNNNDNNIATPEQTDSLVAILVQKELVYANVHEGQLKDSGFLLARPFITNAIYQEGGYSPLWTKAQQWLPLADSVFDFIGNAKLYGLFPEDYHFREVKLIRDKFIADSLSQTDRKDAAFWTKAELLLTDAFVSMVNDVKLGRLPNDSVSMRKDSVLNTSYYLLQLSATRKNGLVNTIHKLEPTHPGYTELKAGIKKFLSTVDNNLYTFIPFPEKDRNKFRQNLQKRLFEGGFIAYDSIPADSIELVKAVKLFQQKKGITVDGVAGEGTIRMLNLNDQDKFVRIAISMDKYKLLPEKMPSRYIWVNVAANFLEVFEDDKVILSSKVITGKPLTRTPMLTSAVSSLITYPQWVPPPSIVTKEILPAVKKNPGYLAKKGFSLLDSKGDEVDPYTVDWSKYKTTIPYRVVQGSGDANALGIIKFVFANKYSVYLHDTNQRYLFSNAMRSLSHGCVRVQNWENLVNYILTADSIGARNGRSQIDSVKSWLKNKQKRTVSLREKLPVYIRYLTCKGDNGSILFYDDIYGDDKYLRQKYYSGK